MRALFAAALAAATAVALAFLVLPVAAIFFRVPPGDLVGALGHGVTRDALLVSLKTSAIAHACVLLVGTPAAYVLARRRFRGRALVLSVAFVESPFYVRGAIAAFEGVDATLLDAARTLGAAPGRVFARVALPLAAGGLAAASALALARGLGEFGATIIFAGSLQGVTQTLPLAIYAQFEQNFDTALAISGLFIVVGAVLLVALKLYPWFRFASIFRSRFAISTSS